jgi:hypothetical protein
VGAERASADLFRARPQATRKTMMQNAEAQAASFAETRKRIVENETGAAAGAGRIELSGGGTLRVKFQNTPPGTKMSAKPDGKLLKKIELDCGQAMTRAAS